MAENKRHQDHQSGSLWGITGGEQLSTENWTKIFHLGDFINKSCIGGAGQVYVHGGRKHAVENEGVTALMKYK